MNSKSYVAFIGAFKVAEGNATEILQHLRGRGHEQPVIIEMETGRQVVFNLAPDPYPAALASAVSARLEPTRMARPADQHATAPTPTAVRKPARRKPPAGKIPAGGNPSPSATVSRPQSRQPASAVHTEEAGWSGAAYSPSAQRDVPGDSAHLPERGLSLEGASEAETPRFQGRGRGRPRLGVVSRDVTLLPDHWQWLAAQPGGASAAIRRLIDGARKQHVVDSRIRRAQEALQRFLATMAEHLPGYQEAARAVAACDVGSFSTIAANWPLDIAQLAVAQMVRIAAEANRKR